MSILLTHASSTNQGHGGGDHEVRGSVIDWGVLHVLLIVEQYFAIQELCSENVRMYEPKGLFDRNCTSYFRIDRIDLIGDPEK